ncbi:MAG: endolytic transglycosylase MltG [Candidatus Eiseniibacteriota bacterium]
MSRRPSRFRPRQLLYVIVPLVLLFVARDVFFPSGFTRSKEVRTVFVRPGATIDEIARDLVQAELLKSPFAFSILARLTGTDRKLKAGQYAFHRGDSVLAILTGLVRGMGGQDLLTVPEGRTARDIADLLFERLGTDPELFLAAVADSALRAEFNAPGATLEGYLFPDTYAFLPTTSPTVIVRTMAGKARRVLDEELARGGPIALELTPHEILTLASIVEAEAMVAAERPRIAAVYLNRLRRGMLLQADPTVAYALGGHRMRIYYSDLRVQSPYNTYLHPGLPPGPIGNPGRSSLQAVLNPTPGSRELFFVARGNGTHIFTETGEAHLKAVAQVRASRAVADTLGPPLPADTTGAARPGADAGPASGATPPGAGETRTADSGQEDG